VTDTLPPFPMCRAFPGSEYYDGSAPSAPFGRRRAYPLSPSWLNGSYAFPSRSPGPTNPAVLGRPDFVAAAPALPGLPRIRLPPASPGRYDGPAMKDSHLHSDKQRLVAHHSPRDTPRAGDRDRRQERSRGAGSRRPGGAPARGVRPGQRGGARSERGGRQDQRDHRVRPTARPYRPHRRDRHRRRPAHPAPSRRLPHRAWRALPAHRQTQPAGLAPPARRAALGRGPRGAPDPRQGPRPGGVPHGQTGRGHRRDRVPARPTRDPDHPPPQVADQPQAAHRDRLRPHLQRHRSRPACRADPRALGHREPTARGP